MSDKLLDELDALHAAAMEGAPQLPRVMSEFSRTCLYNWPTLRAHITELEARNSKLDTLAKLAVAELGRLANQNDDGTVDTVELMGAKMRLTAALEALEDGE